jgi:hypothetical protein
MLNGVNFSLQAFLCVNILKIEGDFYAEKTKKEEKSKLAHLYSFICLTTLRTHL